MLHDAQRHVGAERDFSVSMRTAVWIVMWRQPAMRAPAQRLGLAELLAQRHEAGHLGLGDRHLLAAELRKGDVPDNVVGGGGGCPCVAPRLQWPEP